MAHYSPTYKTYYRGYGLTERKDGTCVASHDTPDLYDKVDYPNIGFGWSVDNGRSYTPTEMRQRIDEVIAERERRIGWVKEFAQTQKKPEWTERYLMSPLKPPYGCKSHHTDAEEHHIWYDGCGYRMHELMSQVPVSKTKFLYRQFLIKKGYLQAV